MSTKVPVYESIKQELKSKIEDGSLPEGARIPSEIELAKQLGVNRSQTRQALRELEVEGYLVRKQGSGSYVAPMAGQMSAVKVAGARAIAIVIPKIIAGHSYNVVQGFMHRASQESLQTLTYNLNLPQPHAPSEPRFLRSVIDSGVTGLVLWIGNDNEQTRALVQELIDKRFPFVLIDRCLPGLDANYVVSDNRALGRSLTQKLLQRGHERICFVGIECPNASSIQDRVEGYRQALEEAGLTYDEQYIINLTSLEQSPQETVGTMMAFCNRPTAFVCVHVDAARPIYNELTKLGYRIGSNFELAIVDDEYPGGMPHVPMIRRPQRGFEIGVQSAEVLLARMNNPEMPTQRLYIEPGAFIESKNEMADAERG
ncbi:MAG: GntR family transcriptional regulator [Candidatus Hydrogenedentes bacterium]|nr:GntR family transcriptional regulator [Candidatus Hydrogenedentota bacterium]